MKSKDIEEACAVIDRSKKTIALTGAGVSTESGIPDFHSKGGLWTRYDPMEYGTIGAFRADPVKVWKMLAELNDIVDAEPNSGHLALADMEAEGFLKGIITQNIDGLHQKAGSDLVVEFHGSLETFSCLDCGNSLTFNEIQQISIPPLCSKCGSILKPDIVFYDEMIPNEVLFDSRELVSGADCLIVAGTSCKVMPAASIPNDVAHQGGVIIEINREPTLGHLADIVLSGSFGEIMNVLAKKLIGNKEQ